MPIVAPGVVRYVVEGSLYGQDCFNIFDYNISDEGIGTSRNDAIEQGAGDLLNQWNDHILPLVSNLYVAERVSWIDLDSLTGTTGGRTSTDGSDWPANGGSAESPMPGNVCMRIRKNISGGRGRRAGQLKLGGVIESWSSGAQPNVWQPNVIGIVADAFEALKDGMNGAADFTGNLVVVHTVDDVYVADSNITSYQPVAQIGSQRRRMPGYGS